MTSEKAIEVLTRLSTKIMFSGLGRSTEEARKETLETFAALGLAVDVLKKRPGRESN